ncbi:endo-1,4-beta-xylanase [Microbacteriaceae bacterium VKM Ac-2855]|nr:endo-1,4-beta-xylanase [Microbacteriaceae bacterium VKM Ac-2855]
MITTTHRPVAALLAAGLTLALGAIAAPSAAAESGPSLRDIAEAHGLTIGSGAINPNYLDDPEFSHVLADEFTSLSPENELKWSLVEPERGQFDFAGLDRLVSFAADNDMVVKGHGLISGCCNPSYLTDITDPTEFRAAMVDHFTTIMHRYADTMDRWDVVTEALSVYGGTGLVHNDFYNVLGPDYIAEAFRIAHAADPDAELFLNENLVEFFPQKQQELYDLVAGLVEDGVPIDGVALQMHETLAGPNPGVLTQIIMSFQALGLDVSIAELDVHTYDATQQAQIYGDVVAEALAAGVTDISTWGFTDKHLYTWLPGAKPLIFDENYTPKPAYFAVRTALASFVAGASAPGRGALSTTSGWSNGLRDGNYDVTMNLWSGTPGSFYRLYENDVLLDTRSLNATVSGAQSVSTAIAGRPNGTYVYRAELVNSHGTTATSTTKVVVKDAAPAMPVVSHDNWDKDGNFTATADLWWGTNATSYTFFLDGTPVGSGPLTAQTPAAQKAHVVLQGVTRGVHVLTVAFSNTYGTTTSRPTSVTVK